MAMHTLIATTVSESFVIDGSQPLNGRVRVAGNKNAALPILAACLLTDEPVVLSNVPSILDVETMLELLVDVGASVEPLGPGTIRIHAAVEPSYRLDEELCRQIRASVLLAGPLLSRCGRAVVPPPGGDVIGRRRIDTHIHAFRQLGAQVSVERAYYMEVEHLAGASIFLDEASVTGTENTIMAAVLAPGETTILNAASEPHVQDLCQFLISLGANIDGVGSNILRIHGVDRLRGGAYSICPDHIEVASFIGLGAVTPGELVIEDVVPEHLVAVWPVFERLGVRWS